MCFLDPFNFSICIHNTESVEEYDCGISASIFYHLFNYHGTSSWSSETRAPWHPLFYFSTFKVLWFNFFQGWSSFPCEAFPLTIWICGSAPMKEISDASFPSILLLSAANSFPVHLCASRSVFLTSYTEYFLHLWRYLSKLRKEESYWHCIGERQHSFIYCHAFF